MLNDFVRHLATLADQTSTTPSATTRIDSIHDFIVANIPYGRIDLSQLQQGPIEYDGYSTIARIRKPPLCWYFGGVPYPIRTALQIHYSYSRIDQAGNTVTLNDALFIGYSQQGQHVCAPQVSASPRNFEDLCQQVEELARTAPTRIVARSYKIDTLDEFLNDSKPQGGEFDLRHALRDRLVSVDYEGPARTNLSYDPFLHTFATIVNTPDQFDQLLFWYFAGRASPITKAMRVAFRPSEQSEQPEFLFVGYRGPGGYG